MNLGRTLHTVRYLKPRQISDRLFRHLKRLKYLPGLSGPFQLLTRSPEPSAEPRDGGFDGRSFAFLNRRIPITGLDRWLQPEADRLWIYNLHYFQFLGGIPAKNGHWLIRDWIQMNDDPGGPGWEPYPLSLRIREWIEWLLANKELDASGTGDIVSSLARQTAALDAQVEYHLMGNHLLENAVTLCWAGLSLEGPWSSRWIERGLSILRTELATQVLPDGTHDERSPMYQAILAEALLRLAGVASKVRKRESEAIRGIAHAAGMTMLGSLSRLVHPDGQYALLNDCAFGIAPTYAPLVKRFGSPDTLRPDTSGSWGLGAAGYFGRHDNHGTYLVFDSGPIGPDHQPGHGHADTLSFELSHRGRRVITDTGVFTYNPGPVRAYDRSTAAHNTIQIDGLDQSELWESFRCARRVSVNSGGQSTSAAGTELYGSYTGPGKAGRRVFHDRSIRVEDSLIHLRDKLHVPGTHQAVLRLHLAPNLSCRPRTDGWEILDRLHPVGYVHGRNFSFNETVTPYHPEFGIEIERRSLVAAFSFHDQTELDWSLRLL